MNCASTLPWLSSEDLTPREKDEAKKIYWGFKAYTTNTVKFKEFEVLFTDAIQRRYNYPENYPSFFSYQLFKDWWDKFWISQDIDATTEENELKEKWEKDVEYAVTHFSFASELRPWDDRGETYIRLGEPNEIERTIEADIEQESWHYWSVKGKYVKIVFESSMRTSGFEVKLKFVSSEDMMNAGEAWAIVQHNKFNYLPGIKVLPCAFDIIKFREDTSDSRGKIQSKYTVYINALIPLKKLSVEPDSLDSLRDKYTLLRRIQILDENKKMVADTSLIVRRVSKKSRNDHLLVLQKEFELPPGIYTIYFTVQDIQDTTSKKLISYTREGYTLVEYAQARETERVSELCLASKIIPAPQNVKNTMFLRNGYQIVPKPDRTFEPDQTIYLYYEIYGLKVIRGKVNILKEFSLYHDGREYKLSSDTLAKDVFDTSISLSEVKIISAAEFSAQTIISSIEPDKSLKIPYIKNGRFEKGGYILVIRIIDLNDNSDKRERITVSGFKIV
jgi:GWxTD domain-containing protein